MDFRQLTVQRARADGHAPGAAALPMTKKLGAALSKGLSRLQVSERNSGGKSRPIAASHCYVSTFAERANDGLL